MAIDYIPHREAQNLAKAEKGFFPAKIPVSHWQLRHYISTPEPDILYYASGQDIYCLNTISKKRKHIATVPFEARCTASGYGWVCVGGGEDDGHFAAIKLDGSPQRDVDMALPIDDHWRAGGMTRRAASVKLERMGEEIVNSVSIHRIKDEEAHLDDIVAVLTNNDKTVRIYSLPAGVETQVKDLGFAMNHATISPDGQTLVAVGDSNVAYFLRREIVATPPQIPKPHNRLTSASVEWKLTSIVTLPVSNPDSTIAFFTTAWSPNGRLIAVGSEAGHITVIDADILMAEERPRFKKGHEDQNTHAIVATVPGSRADLLSPYPGAVRSMIFSPDPWDLLIWAEDQGRICIGDLRTGLKSRQVIDLDPRDEALVKLKFEDLPPSVSQAPHLDDLEADLLRRYTTGQSTFTNSMAMEYIEARRRQQRPRQDVADLQSQPGSGFGDDPHGLTAREQQVLETLRTARQREEARANGSTPRSINYTAADRFSGPGLPSLTDIADSVRSGDILDALQESMPDPSRANTTDSRPSSSHAHESSNPLPSLSALADGVWGSTRGSTHTRSSDGARLPRRWASVAINALASQNTTASTNNGDSPEQSTTPAPGDADNENPWRVIEEQMSAVRSPLFESAARAQAITSVNVSDIPPLVNAAGQLTTELQNELESQNRIRLVQQQQRQRDRLRSTLGNSTSVTNILNGASTSDRPPTILLETRRNVQLPDGYETFLRRRPWPSREVPVGVRMAGLAMSGDGSSVWAASEEGIFEVKLCLKGRMFWPATEPR